MEEGKGRAGNVGHELLSSREWCHSGFVLQLQAVWAAGTGSQMAESRDKGTPWDPGTKGIWAAAKGQESSRELVTHRERSWPTRLGRWAGPRSRAAPQSSPSSPGCLTRAVPPWPGQLEVPSSSLELTGTQTGGLLWGSCHSRCSAGSGSQSCVTPGMDRLGFLPPRSPGLRLQREDVSAQLSRE